MKKFTYYYFSENTYSLIGISVRSKGLHTSTESSYAVNKKEFRNEILQTIASKIQMKENELHRLDKYKIVPQEDFSPGQRGNGKGR